MERQKTPLYRALPLPNEMILVSKKKHPRVYLERAHKLLMAEQQMVYLQATGAAVERAVDLALEIESKYAGVVMTTETFTMPATDEVVNDDGERSTEGRLINGIII
jgi:DNA-binding protein